MALNLNPPSLFQKPRGKDPSNVSVLLPPSSFEKSSLLDRPKPQITQPHHAKQPRQSEEKTGPTKQAINSSEEDGSPGYRESVESKRELELATRQLAQLQEENERLIRSQQRTLAALTPNASEEIKARVDIHQQSSPHPIVSEHAQYLHLRHTADILTRQATEVAQLKAERDETRSRYAREGAELTERLRQVEAEKMGEVANLTAKLRTEEQVHRTQMEDLRCTHSRELTSLHHQLCDLKQSAERKDATYETTVSHLNTELAGSRTQHAQDVTKLKEELRCKEDEASSLSSLVAQLRTYIGETREEAQTMSQWQHDKVRMDNQITDLNKECDRLRSTVELMNIRLSSTNEILRIQESEVAKKTKADGLEIGKIDLGLLTRWREKVFALMVQQKSQDITLMKEAKDQRNIIIDLEHKLTSSQNQCCVLEHSITDRDAQLQMLRDKNQNLEKDLESLKQVMDAMDAQLYSHETAVMALSPVLNGFQGWHQANDVRMQTCVLSKLGAFEQRIQFATSRIDVLKGLFARKDALLKIHQSQDEGSKQSSSSQTVQYDDDGEQHKEERISYNDVITELERVRQERDALAGQIHEDANFFEETLQTTKHKLESRITEKEDEARKLEYELQEKSQQLQSVSDNCEAKEANLSEAMEVINTLKVEITKLQVGADKASKDKCDSIEHQYKSQLIEMEKRLNEARREHAKAVVTSRQLERQHTREKERVNKTLYLQEEQHKYDVAKLTNQLRESEKERNLLMATLRQEGLLTQYKSQRGAAKKMDVNSPSDPEHPAASPDSASPDSAHPAASADKLPLVSAAAHCSTDNTISESQLRQPKGSLSTMLADIRSLTEQVLQDDDDDTKDQEDG